MIKVLPPDTCGECRFYRPINADTGRCRRHAPGTTTEREAIALWPIVPVWSRCGIGEVAGQPITTCIRCTQWFRVNGEGIDPKWGLHGHTKAWWEETAWCTRYSPSPSSREPELTQWHVTHATDECGNGTDFEKGIEP